EEKRALPLRCGDHACSRLAESDLSVVPRQRIVSIQDDHKNLTLAQHSRHHFRSPSKPYSTHRILLGTHTSGQAQDYLQIATVQIPKRENPLSGADKLDASDYDDERGELGGHTIPPAPRIQ